MGCLLRFLVVLPAELIGGSGADLDSYFNRLAQDLAAIPLNAFGNVVSPELARRHGYDPGIPMRMAVAVVAMGAKTLRILRSLATWAFSSSGASTSHRHLRYHVHCLRSFRSSGLSTTMCWW